MVWAFCSALTFGIPVCGAIVRYHGGACIAWLKPIEPPINVEEQVARDRRDGRRQYDPQEAEHLAHRDQHDGQDRGVNPHALADDARDQQIIFELLDDHIHQ